MRQLNLDHLHTLRMVATTGGFTAAARRLNLTQSAVSVQIRDLEARMGVRLLDRLGKTAHPTPAGRELLAHADNLLAQAEEAEQALNRYKDGWLGEVRIGASPTALNYHLPPLLAALKRHQPSLILQLTAGTTRSIAERLTRNEIDLGVVSLPVDERNLSVTLLLVEDLVAVFPSDAPRPPDVVTPEVMASQPLLLEVGHAQVKQSIVEWLAAVGDPPKPAMELENLEVIARMVAAGLGTSIIPARVVAERARLGQVLVRPLEPRLQRRLVLVQRADKLSSPAIDVTRAALLQMA